MDLATIIGLAVGLVVIVIVMIMDGGSPAELFAHPSAILLIVGGSLAATTITTSVANVTKLPVLIMQAFTTSHHDVQGLIDKLVTMADKARKEGLLALEEESKTIEDEFMKKGVMMVVDGIDASQVRAILETTIDQMRLRHRAGFGFFAAAGGFAPTFGIIGTVMGLISVLKQLDDPSSLGKSIAAAFLATLWGLLMSNLIYLPISAKLKAKSEHESELRYMIMEGILSIQAGENPRVVRDKLSSYLPPVKSKAEGEEKKANQKSGRQASPQANA